MKHYRYIMWLLGVLFLFSSCTVSPIQPSGEDSSSDHIIQNTVPANDSVAGSPSSASNPQNKISGSITTSRYTITDIEGTCYLNYAEGNTPSIGNDEYPSQQIGFLSFSSIDELYRVFANNMFSEEQIEIMKQAFSHGEHGIVVPNIHQLLVPVLPEGMQIAGVGLTDNVYTYSVQTENSNLGCGVKFASEGLYRALYEKNYTEYFLNEKFFDITSEEGIFDETNCLIYEYQTAVVTKRTYQIQVQDNEKTVSILIHYVTESSNQYVEVSETIPDSINIFYEKNGQYMILHLYNFDSEPSLDWLLSFDCSVYEVPTPTT